MTNQTKATEDTALCGICGEEAQAECEECGDDLCADDLATHMEEHADEHPENCAGGCCLG